MPVSALNVDYNISFSLPDESWGNLVGLRGDVIKKIESTSKAVVELNKQAVVGHRQISIVGPMLAVYVAHMEIMRLYNDVIPSAITVDDPQHQTDAPQRQIQVLKSRRSV